MNSRLCVCIPSYNHEKYIAQCLDSVIAQKEVNDFVISVSDDCSSDSTPEILKKYQTRYPEIIRLNLRSSNVGMVRNITENIYSAGTDFIALLEGDDYWADEDKLHRQLSFLQNDETLGFVCSSQIVLEGGKQIDHIEYKQPFRITLDDFIRKNLKVFNNTKMFRTTILPENLPDWYYNSHLWDWLMHIFMLEKADGYYDPKPTLMYRRHENAYISERNTIARMNDCLVVLPHLDLRLNRKYTQIFSDTTPHFSELAVAHYKQHNFLSFLKYTLLYFSNIKNVHPRDFLWKLRH